MDIELKSDEDIPEQQGIQQISHDEKIYLQKLFDYLLSIKPGTAIIIINDYLLPQNDFNKIFEEYATAPKKDAMVVFIVSGRNIINKESDFIGFHIPKATFDTRLILIIRNIEESTAVNLMKIKGLNNYKNLSLLTTIEKSKYEEKKPNIEETVFENSPTLVVWPKRDKKTWLGKLGTKPKQQKILKKEPNIPNVPNIELKEFETMESKHQKIWEKWPNIAIISFAFFNISFIILFGVYLYQNKQKQAKYIAIPLMTFVAVSVIFNGIALTSNDFVSKIIAISGTVINLIMLLFYLNWYFKYVAINDDYINYANIGYVVATIIIIALNTYEIFVR